METSICDISEELNRQLEDIINTYGSGASSEQESTNKEPEDDDKGESDDTNGEQPVTSDASVAKEASAGKEQKLEKKIIKGLGSYNDMKSAKDSFAIPEMMSKKMKTLEKETTVWRTRFESCNKALLDVIEEKVVQDKEFECFQLKIQRLEKLCRALQDERTVLYKKISEIRGTREEKEEEDSEDQSAKEVKQFPLPQLPCIQDPTAAFTISHIIDEEEEEEEGQRLKDYQLHSLGQLLQSTMSKKMKTLEKETTVWRTRFESCNKALLDVIEEKVVQDKEFECFQLKIQRLEKLCRALQDERTVLYKKISEIRGTREEKKEEEDSEDQSAKEVKQFPLPQLPCIQDPTAAFTISHIIDEEEEEEEGPSEASQVAEVDSLPTPQPGPAAPVNSESPAEPTSDKPSATQENTQEQTDRDMEAVD
ncbi:UNVERIFIED_CONTAM: hypothetical protein FKN15_019148 [Acipenser sinensis]